MVHRRLLRTRCGTDRMRHDLARRRHLSGRSRVVPGSRTATVRDALRLPVLEVAARLVRAISG
jgi:hypothetical protein